MQYKHYPEIVDVRNSDYEPYWNNGTHKLKNSERTRVDQMLKSSLVGNSIYFIIFLGYMITQSTDKWLQETNVVFYSFLIQLGVLRIPTSFAYYIYVRKNNRDNRFFWRSYCALKVIFCTFMTYAMYAIATSTNCKSNMILAPFMWYALYCIINLVMFAIGFCKDILKKFSNSGEFDLEAELPEIEDVQIGSDSLTKKSCPFWLIGVGKYDDTVELNWEEEHLSHRSCYKQPHGESGSCPIWGSV